MKSVNNQKSFNFRSCQYWTFLLLSWVFSFRCWQCSCEFCCRSMRTHIVLHFPPKTSCFFKLAYSMNSIPLYVTRGTCFLLQYAIFYCVLFIFRVVLGLCFVNLYFNKAFVFSLLQAASKARERNPGKNHRYNFSRFSFSSWGLLVNSADLRKFRIICFFSRKME